MEKEYILHKAKSRGFADHGWLKSFHTFSFANYHNPQRMHFGVLRVLNDDYVREGMGFGTHPHQNMEIISIPLSGELQHQDDMGNTSTIKKGEIQVMSAGTGVYHSEYNPSKFEPVEFLQIWVFPNKKNVEPRYDQKNYISNNKLNSLQQILSPNPDDEGVWIHQNAWFYYGKFEANKLNTYTLNDKENGIYIFVINGNILIDHLKLSTRDGLGIKNGNEINYSTISDVEFLLMEIPI